MRIIIKNAKRDFRLRFPSWLVLNGFSAWLLHKRCFKNHDMRVKIKARDLRLFFREIRRMKKIYPEWQAVSVRSAKGSIIHIKL